MTGGRVLAGVDIGTLTCRLLIGEVTRERRIRVLRGDRKILRLGEGVAKNRRLRGDAMDRVVETLREWRNVIRDYDVSGEVAVATSAVRDADNREAFLGRIRDEAGFDVELISGEEEARRTLLGIRSGLPKEAGGILGLDIGGGSTEFIMDRPGRPLAVRSMELGVVRVTELALIHDPPTEADRRRAEELVLNAVRSAMASLGSPDGLTLVGTAGTITTLAAMAQGLVTYDASRVQGFTITRDTVQRLEADILRRSIKERQGMPGLESGREEVIAAGTVIIRTIMDELRVDRCLVSEYGLREGILVDLAERMGGSG